MARNGRKWPGAVVKCLTQNKLQDAFLEINQNFKLVIEITSSNAAGGGGHDLSRTDFGSESLHRSK